MKINFKLLLLALIGLVLCSCSGLFGGKEPEYQLSDLQGLWQKNNTQEFVRFTNEASEESGYLLGLEWNNAEWEEEEPYEDFLKEERATMGHPTDGWFRYSFSSSGNLVEYHYTTNGSTDAIAKRYVVSKLTKTALEYYEKDNKKRTSSFTKVE